MKNLIVEQIEKTILIDEIIHIEKKLDIKLPEDYIDHLLKFNGGHPIKDFFPLSNTYISHNILQDEGRICWFYAIYNGEYENFIEHYHTFKNRIPEELIPIGRDGFGSQICLCIAGNNYGKLYFEDKDFRPYLEGEEPSWDNMYLIANSFKDFINSLYYKDLEMDAKGYATKWIYTHDKYSLPVTKGITEQQKKLAIWFFSQCPKEVEDYVITEIMEPEERAVKELVLSYEIPHEHKKHIRRITPEGVLIEDKFELITTSPEIIMPNTNKTLSKDNKTLKLPGFDINSGE